MKSWWSWSLWSVHCRLVVACVHSTESVEWYSLIPGELQAFSKLSFGGAFTIIFKSMSLGLIKCMLFVSV